VIPASSAAEAYALLDKAPADVLQVILDFREDPTDTPGGEPT
jgi:hypothetical protein